MVIRTENCVFSGKKIYPYRGVVFIRNDGKQAASLSHKILKLNEEKKKPLNYKWTYSWRKKNKKTGNTVAAHKKKRVKERKVEVSFQGMTIEEFNNRKKKRVDAKKEVALKRNEEAQARKKKTN